MNNQQANQRALLIDEFHRAISSVHLLEQAADLYSSHEASDTRVVDRYERLVQALEGVVSILITLQSEFQLRDPEIDDRHREVK